MPTTESIAAIKTMLWSQLYTHWLNQELFSFTWWFTVLFLVISYIIWWKLLDKSRLVELLLFGSLLAVMSAVYDTVAENLVLWQYKVKIFPFTPGFFPFHLTLTPIVFIMTYQYTNSWRKYLIAAVLAAAVYSFAIVPVFVAVGELQYLNWNYGYTFITMIARGVIAKWILMLCKNIQASHQKQPEPSHSFWPIYEPTAKPLPDKKIDEEGGSDK